MSMDFYDAARAEILTRLGHEAQLVDGEKRVTAFVSGAEWGRRYEAGREASDAEVEAVARAVDPHSWSVYDRITKWERDTGNFGPPYPMAHLVEPSTRTARAALTAARKAGVDV